MAATYSTEEFISAAGRFGGVHTNKEGEKYFVETGTKRHIQRRFGIPVETTNAKGKVSRRLVGTFNTIAGALAWAFANSPQTHHALIRNTLCDYYGQPRQLSPGPTTAMLKADPSCDDRYANDANIPGVQLAADYKPKKRKATKRVDGKAVPKTKPKKKPVLQGSRGITLVRASKNADKALVPLESAMDVLKARERMARWGSNIAEVEQDGLTFIFQQSPDEERAAKLKPNPWAGDGQSIQGDFMVRASKKFKLQFSE